MFRFLRKFFIPSDENNFIPHFFREKFILCLSALVILAFFVSLLNHSLLVRPEIRSAVLIPVLLDLANNDRLNEGLNTLKENTILSKAAQKKAEDMALKGYFAHNSPDGRTPWSFILGEGYKFTHAGENLAMNFSDSEKVQKAWMNSALHRANILNKSFTEMGIGVASGIYEGRSTLFVVQMFGRPTPSPAKNLAFVEVGKTGEQKTVGQVRGDFVAVDEFLPTKEVTETFIEYENGIVNDRATTESLSQSPNRGYENKALNIIGRILSSPRSTLEMFYVVIASIVALCLLLFVFVEYQKQSPVHIGYSLFVFVLIGAMWYLQEAVIFGGLAVK